ncbi:MAG TPA: HAMP domain-containing sensor histidine kinase [Micromonosporaceae bacterium]
MGWWRRLTLRARLVLIGATGLAVAFAVGGVLLVDVLHYVLQRSVDGGARQVAADVAALERVNHLSDPIPPAGNQIVQVVDGDQRVRAATVGADRLTPLLRPAELSRASRGAVVVVPGARAGLDGPLRVVAAPAGTPAGPHTVLVAAPVGDLEASVAAVRDALLVVYPLLVGLLAALAWRVVGWTLRPVEALRRGAEEIGGGSGRIPVPDGRDEVHRLAVTLNGMLERLERSRYRQRAFVADAAHELRSPIASLHAQLDVAAHLGEPVGAEDLLADVERLSRLVDDLLLLARADEGDPSLRRRDPVDLGEVCAEVAEARSGGRVPVAVRVADAAPVLGDRMALHRVVDNLVSNAVRHAASRVEIVVGPGATVTVGDDGPGIAPADRDRVFDRFTRLDDARARDDGGAGLGLAIVRELVRLHDGTIDLADARPGLRVAVTLPTPDQPPRPDQPRPDQPRPDQPPTSPQASGPPQPSGGRTGAVSLTGGPPPS